MQSGFVYAAVTALLKGTMRLQRYFFLSHLIFSKVRNRCAINICCVARKRLTKCKMWKRANDLWLCLCMYMFLSRDIYIYNIIYIRLHSNDSTSNSWATEEKQKNSYLSWGISGPDFSMLLCWFTCGSSTIADSFLVYTCVCVHMYWYLVNQGLLYRWLKNVTRERIPGIFQALW